MKPPAISSTEDLARHLGVSRWTVSRALNGHADVRESTRRRILEAARELDFRPNAMALGLRGARTGLIGICFQEIESPILARKVAGLQAAIREAGFRGLLDLSSGRPAVEEKILQHFLDLKVDAVILIGSGLGPENAILTRYADSRTALLAIDPVHELPFPRLGIDRGAAMMAVLEHLYGLGHREFALLGINSDPVYGPARLKGLRSGARKLGLPWKKAFQFFDDECFTEWSYEYGYALAERVVEAGGPPGALIALNDRIAIGAMRRLQEKGFGIPADCSVSGFDDLDIARWTQPRLTSVSQEPERLIRETIEMLRRVESGEHKRPPVRIITPRLVVRETTGPAPDRVPCASESGLTGP